MKKKKDVKREPLETCDTEDDCPDRCVQVGESVELVTFLPKGSKLYTKKPVQIRAVLMTEPFAVKTLEGVMTGKAGDYLIEGIKGELYPCKPDIFVESYQAT